MYTSLWSKKLYYDSFFFKKRFSFCYVKCYRYLCRNKEVMLDKKRHNR